MPIFQKLVNGPPLLFGLQEYVVWFNLQALLYLIENKEGKTPKKIKIGRS